MKILTNAKAIRKTLRELKPASIAVAYVGVGWKSYISTKSLREIVLSPTLGSNPRAIEEMMQELGHENVHFLDHLHSKIYLGANAALLGSCNLSDNGISDNGLLEAAVLLAGENARKSLAAQFETYKAAARKLYPTKQSKINCLKNLKQMSDKAQWNGWVTIDAKSPSIGQYNSQLDRIHVAWCDSSGVPYNEQTIGKKIKDAENDPDDYFSYTIQFGEKDDVRPGDWVLCWRCTKNGMPRKRGDVSWLYVHDVVPGGFDSADYSKLVGEAKSRFRKRPMPPFVLDEPTKRLIRETLSSRRFPELLPNDSPIWDLAQADAVTPSFIDTLKSAANSTLRGRE